MPVVEKITIFLASPSDVALERRYVDQVVAEVNRTVGRTQGIVLDVIRWERDSYPGYGKDAQALVNDQIAAMGGFDLFVGMMWNRVGTRTPRAVSGTVEEFDRAVAAHKKLGRPEIWFYFRTSPARLESDDQLEQKKQVVAFKRRVRRNGAPWDYKNPAEFRELFRGHLMNWLARRGIGNTEDMGRARVRPGSKSATRQRVTRQESVRGTAGSSASKAKSGTTRSARRSAASARSNRATGVASSGTWLMLGDAFFRAASVTYAADHTITLRMPSRDAEAAATLRALRPSQFSGSSQLPYAYQDEAHLVSVESVESESVSGKTVYTVRLKPDDRSHRSYGEYGVNNYSADDIAEMRAQLLLLGEPPAALARDDLGWLMQMETRKDNPRTGERGLFRELWANWKVPAAQFLPRARLMAVYHLKVSRTVEDVLELRLGPVKGGSMPVRFRGRRRRQYSDEKPREIRVSGTCRLTA